MDDFNTGRSKSWNFYSNSNPSPPPRPGGVYREEAPWSSSNNNNYGTTTSMNAVSFGFVATAILISMFLIMAIFEHYLFKPTSNSISHQDATPRSSQARAKRKLATSPQVAELYSTDFSVVMPGQDYPTYIAQPAPFLPCPREGACWPSHEHHHHVTTTIHLPS